ncbi:Predicted phage recombinase, RecA/RadA family [Monaibacterium marinum]|uniref:Predicted phage recombinase, RecA/RadA family n=1 Tax=Pontivivens marinum TaxID=1690039 RepID=A0A2C9CSL5_9RHOB|nr:DUF2190 family protein [Monaibacterium marinum]SOH93369.1 Predicted phage recombinase, RecA/RadA family [Monaibacterium marinum]
MKNYVQPGDHVTVPAPSGGVTAGALVTIAALSGVAQAAAAEGEPVELVRKGVFDLPKTSAQAWAVGEKIYATAAGVCTTVASSNMLVGVAVEVAANPSGTGRVLLDGAAR